MEQNTVTEHGFSNDGIDFNKLEEKYAGKKLQETHENRNHTEYHQ